MPRNQGPRSARGRRTRAALLAAARTVLEQGGFDALTMGAVAERAGLSRRAVYLHFVSRADLVLALFDDASASERLSEPADLPPDPVTALEEWTLRVVRCYPRLSAVARAFGNLREADGEAARQWELVAQDQIRACRRLIERLEEQGRLAPTWTVEAAADLLWGLMSFDLLERLTVDGGWSVDECARRLSALVRTTFVTGSEAGPVPTPVTGPVTGAIPTPVAEPVAGRA